MATRLLYVPRGLLPGPVVRHVGKKGRRLPHGLDDELAGVSVGVQGVAFVELSHQGFPLIVCHGALSH